MFSEKIDKSGKFWSSVVLSGAVLNSALVSTVEVGAVKSLKSLYGYYMNQCWFLRSLLNLFCSVPFFSDPFQKVFCVPGKNVSYNVPGNFYSSLVKYEGQSICMPRYLVENIINEESKKKFKEMLKKYDDLVEDDGRTVVRFVTVSESGRLAIHIGDHDKYDGSSYTLITQYSASDGNKINELCEYLDSFLDEGNYEFYKGEFGEFERVFFSPIGVSDELLKNVWTDLLR